MMVAKPMKFKCPKECGWKVNLSPGEAYKGPQLIMEHMHKIHKGNPLKEIGVKTI